MPTRSQFQEGWSTNQLLNESLHSVQGSLNLRDRHNDLRANSRHLDPSAGRDPSARPVR